MCRGNDEAGHLTAPDQSFQDLLTPNSDPGHPHPLMCNRLSKLVFDVGVGGNQCKSGHSLSYKRSSILRDKDETALAVSALGAMPAH